MLLVYILQTALVVLHGVAIILYYGGSSGFNASVEVSLNPTPPYYVTKLAYKGHYYDVMVQAIKSTLRPGTISLLIVASKSTTGEFIPLGLVYMHESLVDGAVGYATNIWDKTEGIDPVNELTEDEKLLRFCISRIYCEQVGYNYLRCASGL